MNADKYDASLDNYNWLAREVDRHETWQALELAYLLYNNLHPKDVIDFGCSSGIYLVYFKAMGCQVLGIDGASGVGKWIPNEFWVRDLREEMTPYSAYDLALCIETGEHIRPEFHETLVGNINAQAVFWSAAPPGQGGEGHVGEMPKQYWIDLFAKHGYHIHPLNDKICEVINHDDPYAHCNWLRNNAVLFEKNAETNYVSA